MIARLGMVLYWCGLAIASLCEIAAIAVVVIIVTGNAFLTISKPLAFYVLHYHLGKMRAFLWFDPVRASPIRIVFLWVADKG